MRVAAREGAIIWQERFLTSGRVAGAINRGLLKSGCLRKMHAICAAARLVRIARTEGKSHESRSYGCGCGRVQPFDSTTRECRRDITRRRQCVRPARFEYGAGDGPIDGSGLRPVRQHDGNNWHMSRLLTCYPHGAWWRK
jgi:hypothetical protein